MWGELGRILFLFYQESIRQTSFFCPAYFVFWANKEKRLTNGWIPVKKKENRNAISLPLFASKRAKAKPKKERER